MFLSDLGVHLIGKSLANLFGVLINNRLYLLTDASNLRRSDPGPFGSNYEVPSASSVSRLRALA
jgi:hypothetical protein